MRALTFAIGLVIGLVIGAGAMLIAFPYLFPPPPAADAAPAGATTSRLGTFTFDPKAPGRDAVHWADGTGAVLRVDGSTIVRFESDFRAGPGPNYWVYLNTTPVGDETTFLADAGRLRVAPLRSFSGAQNFPLPAGTDIAGFKTVTVWCESFSAYIGSAALP